MVAPPFAVKTAEGSWEGLSIDLWQRVAGELNLDYELLEYSIQGEIVRDLEKGDLDVVVLMSATADHEVAFDLSQSYYRSGLGIAVPAGHSGINWLGIANHLFSRDVLGLFAGLLLLTALSGTVIWLIEHRRNREMFGGKSVRGIGQSMWWAMVTMTTVGYGDKVPKSFWGRGVAFVWMIISIVVVACFTATITTSLTVSELKGKVHGLRDLYTVRVGAPAQTEVSEFLSEHGIAIREFKNIQEGLQAVDNGEIDAFVANEAVLKYYVKNIFPGRLNVLAETFNHFFVCMGLAPQSRLREPLNRSLLTLFSADDWKRSVSFYTGSEN
jgi:polar amino acid transport system substrate-binding protein